MHKGAWIWFEVCLEWVGPQADGDSADEVIGLDRKQRVEGGEFN